MNIHATLNLNSNIHDQSLFDVCVYVYVYICIFHILIDICTERNITIL